jgi:hypothetical protein
MAGYALIAWVLATSVEQVADLSTRVAHISCSSRTEDPTEAFVNIVSDLVLPEAYHAPPHPSQRCVTSAISRPVPLNLLSPKWRQRVCPTRKSISMPKISIHEYSSLQAGNDKIRTAGQTAMISLKFNLRVPQRPFNNLFERCALVPHL